MARPGELVTVEGFMTRPRLSELAWWKILIFGQRPKLHKWHNWARRRALFQPQRPMTFLVTQRAVDLNRVGYNPAARISVKPVAAGELARTEKSASVATSATVKQN